MGAGTNGLQVISYNNRTGGPFGIPETIPSAWALLPLSRRAITEKYQTYLLDLSAVQHSRTDLSRCFVGRAHFIVGRSRFFFG